MNQAEIIGYTIYLTAAFLSAVIVVVSVGVSLEVERRLSRWTIPMVAPLLCFAIGLGSLTSGRNLTFFEMDLANSIGDGGGAGSSMAMRALTLVILGMSFAALLSRAFSRLNHAEDRARDLIGAFLVYFIFNNILNGVLGSHPGFQHNSLYAAFVFMAIYTTRSRHYTEFIRLAKLSILVLMVASLIAAAALPTLALQPYSQGVIPGLTVRLWGVGSNPNSIGPLALVLILLEFGFPSATRFGRVATLVPTWVVLILAQSKTAWFVGLIMAVVILLYRSVSGPGKKRGVPVWLIFVVLGVMAMAILTSAVDVGAVRGRVISAQDADNVESLSGRLRIWLAAIDAWSDSPLFGYGPEVWGPIHRIRIGMPFAVTAHNQVLQSLSAAGAFGAISLLTYVIVLAKYAFAAAGRTRGVSLGLLVLLILRSITETPLTIGTLFNGDLLTHLILFRMVTGARSIESVKEPFPTGRLASQSS